MSVAKGASAGGLDWNDVEAICQELELRQPTIDSRDMTDEEVRALVCSLEGFVGDPAGGDAGHMEAIRAGVWWGG